MGDDAFYTPGRVVPPRVRPRPAEPLWEVHRAREHDSWACELRYHGEWGVEAQLLQDGDLRISRMWQTRALAVAWAEAERRDLEAGRYDDVVLDDIVF